MYIVTGLPRSGTSMMTRCIALSSDLPYIYDYDYEDRLRTNEADPTYDPNPNGYWVTDMLKRRSYRGKLFKTPLNFALRVRPENAKAIIMRRDMAAIQASYQRAFNGELTPLLLRQAEDGEAHLRTFADIIEINYEDVIADGLREFEKIRDAGWPIDPYIAASLVEEDLQRN